MSDSDADVHHAFISYFTGRDAFVYAVLPRRWAASFFSRELWRDGRRSFTLPDGSTWEILSPGKVQPAERPKGLEG